MLPRSEAEEAGEPESERSRPLRLPHPNRLPGEKPNPISSIPFVLVHFVPILAIFTGVGWHDWQILLVTYWARMFFITAGYHRYFAHRSFKTSRVFQFILALGGTTATQKGPL